MQIQSQTVTKSPKSIYISNIVFSANKANEFNAILNYYGWIPENDIWFGHNDNGDEIRVKVEESSYAIESVELLTLDVKRLKERLATLQYYPANIEQTEPVPGQNQSPKAMYANGRKRVAVYPRGNRTLIVIFRSTKQGYTRFGPSQK